MKFFHVFIFSLIASLGLSSCQGGVSGTAEVQSQDSCLSGNCEEKSMSFHSSFSLTNGKMNSIAFQQDPLTGSFTSACFNNTMSDCKSASQSDLSQHAGTPLVIQALKLQLRKSGQSENNTPIDSIRFEGAFFDTALAVLNENGELEFEDKKRLVYPGTIISSESNPYYLNNIAYSKKTSNQSFCDTSSSSSVGYVEKNDKKRILTGIAISDEMNVQSDGKGKLNYNNAFVSGSEVTVAALSSFQSVSSSFLKFEQSEINNSNSSFGLQNQFQLTENINFSHYEYLPLYDRSQKFYSFGRHAMNFECRVSTSLRFPQYYETYLNEYLDNPKRQCLKITAPQECFVTENTILEMKDPDSSLDDLVCDYSQGVFIPECRKDYKTLTDKLKSSCYTDYFLEEEDWKERVITGYCLNGVKNYTHPDAKYISDVAERRSYNISQPLFPKSTSFFHELKLD